jgi:hypothetical protein
MPADFITRLARRSGIGFQDLKLANCAGCGCEVTSNAHNAGRYAIERLFGRIKGRPYCETCYRIKEAQDELR